MAGATGSTPLATRSPGVIGEFHAQGNLLLAARTARRRGFAGDRMWFIGDPAVDRTGAPMGFVLPVSFVREMGLMGLLVGLLLGFLFGMFYDFHGYVAGLQRLPGALVTGALIGSLSLLLVGWAALSARIGAYLFKAQAGSLHLKIGLPMHLPEAEREHLAETAELVLREAKAETIRHVDGTVEVNSPQSPAYVA